MIPKKYKAKDLTDLYKKIGTERMFNLIDEAKKYYLNTNNEN